MHPKPIDKKKKEKIEKSSSKTKISAKPIKSWYQICLQEKNEG